MGEVVVVIEPKMVWTSGKKGAAGEACERK